MLHFFLKKQSHLEYCFNVEASAPLSQEELFVLKNILADGFILESIYDSSTLDHGQEVIELGPRMNFATAYSTNIVSICKTCGLEKIVRIERSRRYLFFPGPDRETFIRDNHDRMTECLYERP